MDAEADRKLFVAGLSDDVSEDMLRGAFTQLGLEVADLALPRDRASGKPRGFAFVTLGSAEQAASARAQLDGYLLNGRPMRVRPFDADPGNRSTGGAKPFNRRTAPGGPPPRAQGAAAARGKRADSDRTAWVGNLPFSSSEQELRSLLESAGTAAPERVYLPTGADGRVRGFAFVAFPSPEEARSAVDVLQSAELGGRKLAVHMADDRRPARAPRPASSGGGGGPGAFEGPDPGDVWMMSEGKGAERPRREKSKKKKGKRRSSSRSWDDDDWE